MSKMGNTETNGINRQYLIESKKKEREREREREIKTEKEKITWEWKLENNVDIINYSLNRYNNNNNNNSNRKGNNKTLANGNIQPVIIIIIIPQSTSIMEMIFLMKTITNNVIEKGKDRERDREW